MKSLKKYSFVAILVAIFFSLNSCSDTNRHANKTEKNAIREDVSATEEAPNSAQTTKDAKESAKPNKADSIKVSDYKEIVENPFLNATQAPLSTFSIDVDNASYSQVRTYLNSGQMPPADAVRIEELINYFDYDYPQPKSEHPFSIIGEVGASPWNKENKIVHIGLQGKSLNYNELKPSNLVFLIDASGSMSDENKLPLVKKSLKLLLNELSDNDKISIVAYAGGAGLILSPTKATEKDKILDALNSLTSGGGTAGEQGIKLAYEIAEKNLIKNGNNRVILVTDGDFNVGVSSDAELVKLMTGYRQKDIYLTICGFGIGNYQDGKMEEISKAGSGNYFYIDGFEEAKKVFVKEMRANMFTIAKDVKIQVEFNPKKVKAYRLIGYENRVMPNEDFNNDLKDAGELGAGHSVTALYEIIPVGSSQNVASIDPLKYQTTKLSNEALGDEIVSVKFRYKPLKSDKSVLITTPIKDQNQQIENTSENFQFSAAVAGFGLILRNSAYKGTANYKEILALAKKSKGNDANGYRSEFIKLIETAELLKK